MSKPKPRTGQTWKRKGDAAPTVTITVDEYDDDANAHTVNVKCRCNATKNSQSVSLAFFLQSYLLVKDIPDQAEGTDN